jgi:hypothetical protein
VTTKVPSFVGPLTQGSPRDSLVWSRTKDIATPFSLRPCTLCIHHPSIDHTTSSLQQTNNQYLFIKSSSLLPLNQQPTTTTTLKMSASVEYLNVDPNVAREQFQNDFDLNAPDQAMTSYQKLMHEHTRQQFENATASSRRRSSGPSVASLSSETSRGSTSSTSS